MEKPDRYLCHLTMGVCWFRSRISTETWRLSCGDVWSMVAPGFLLFFCEAVADVGGRMATLEDIFAVT